MSRHVVLSGCSGGGKSTLLDELARRGHATVPEPGRRIVAQELQGDGSALPWVDLAAFARRAIGMAIADRAAADPYRLTFFDRGLVDAACALDHATGIFPTTLVEAQPLYHRLVFLAPPWPEIYAADAERRHGLEEATAEYERLERAYARLGYEPVIVPTGPVTERASFLLDRIEPARYPAPG